MSMLSDLVERVRALIFRRSEEQQLEEELRFHVEMEEEFRRRAGASPTEAHRHARIALGGVERVKDDVRDARGTRWLDDVGSRRLPDSGRPRSEAIRPGACMPGRALRSSSAYPCQKERKIHLTALYWWRR